MSGGGHPTSGHGKKVISHIDCSPTHAMVTLLYRTLQSTLGYDTVIRRTCLQAVWLRRFIQNCGHTAEWLHID